MGDKYTELKKEQEKLMMEQKEIHDKLRKLKEEIDLIELENIDKPIVDFLSTNIGKILMFKGEYGETVLGTLKGVCRAPIDGELCIEFTEAFMCVENSITVKESYIFIPAYLDDNKTINNPDEYFKIISNDERLEFIDKWYEKLRQYKIK